MSAGTEPGECKKNDGTPNLPLCAARVSGARCLYIIPLRIVAAFFMVSHYRARARVIGTHMEIFVLHVHVFRDRRQRDKFTAGVQRTRLCRAYQHGPRHHAPAVTGGFMVPGTREKSFLLSSSPFSLTAKSTVNHEISRHRRDSRQRVNPRAGIGFVETSGRDRSRIDSRRIFGSAVTEKKG